MEIHSSFRHRRWVVDFVAELLNTRQGIPFIWNVPTDIETEFGPSGRDLADSEFAKSLSALVDQWIGSARSAEGRVVPLDRNVVNEVSGFDMPLLNVLRDWYGRHLAPPALLRTGKMAVVEPAAYFPGLSPVPFGREHAIYWLVQLLDSPYSHYLERCQNAECRRYYVRQRLRKSEILRGTYCGNCSVVGSTVRMNISRELRKRTLIGMAAEVWPLEWKPKRGYRKLSDWVAAEMKKKKANRPVTVTGKWVTQNREAIEIEVERRKNGKG
jgi:hypothetical protein